MGKLFTNLKKRVAILTVLCMMLTLAPSPAFATTVSDISGHWAQTTIQSWVDNGLIKGYPDGTFKPDNNITRAEFITLVNRAFEYTNTAPISFSDVNQNAWYASAIGVAVEAGYISGYPDGTMKPENPISREEAATIIMRIKNLVANPAAVSVYTDASSITWGKGEVGAVTAAKIMQGYPDGSFMPRGLITRAETVIALDNAMHYTVPADDVIPPVVDGGGGGGSHSHDMAVSAITVTPTAMTLIEGGATGTAIATVSPTNATNQTVTWSSDDEAVATVVGGVVTPLTTGTAIITATTADGNKTATCTVTVITAAEAALAAAVTAANDASAAYLSAGGVTTAAVYVDVQDALAADPQVTADIEDTTALLVAATTAREDAAAASAAYLSAGGVTTAAVYVDVQDALAADPQVTADIEAATALLVAATTAREDASAASAAYLSAGGVTTAAVYVDVQDALAADPQVTADIEAATALLVAATTAREDASAAAAAYLSAGGVTTAAVYVDVQDALAADPQVTADIEVATALLVAATTAREDAADALAAYLLAGGLDTDAVYVAVQDALAADPQVTADIEDTTALLVTATTALEDAAAADAVDVLIAALPAAGTVELTDQTQIEEARAAYDLLTPDQLALMTEDEATLIAAEDELVVLTEAAIAAINAGGATVQNYTDAGITGVTSNNLAGVNTAVAAAKVTKGSNLTRLEIQAVVDKGAAIKAINAGTAILETYTVAEITGVTEGNLANVNTAVVAAKADKGSDLTRSEIQDVVDRGAAIKAANDASEAYLLAGGLDTDAVYVAVQDALTADPKVTADIEDTTALLEAATTALEEAAALEAAVTAAGEAQTAYTTAGGDVALAVYTNVTAALAAEPQVTADIEDTTALLVTATTALEDAAAALAGINAGTEVFADFSAAGVTGAIEASKAGYDTAIAAAIVTKGSDLTLAEVQSEVDAVNTAVFAATELAGINAGTEVFADFATAGVTGAIEASKAGYDTAIAAAIVTKGSDLTLAEVQSEVDAVNP